MEGMDQENVRRLLLGLTDELRAAAGTTPSALPPPTSRSVPPASLSDNERERFLLN